MLDLRRMYDPLQGLDPDGEMSQPVIVFFNGEAAYEFVSNRDLAGFGKHAKYEYYFQRLQQNTPIDISLIDTLSLEEGRFRISQGRHRAVVFALRNVILSLRSASPAAQPEIYEKGPVPFLTFRDSAQVMKSKGCARRSIIRL